MEKRGEEEEGRATALLQNKGFKHLLDPDPTRIRPSRLGLGRFLKR